MALSWVAGILRKKQACVARDGLEREREREKQRERETERERERERETERERERDLSKREREREKEREREHKACSHRLKSEGWTDESLWHEHPLDSS